jgi:hypothetical protein
VVGRWFAEKNPLYERAYRLVIFDLYGLNMTIHPKARIAPFLVFV